MQKNIEIVCKHLGSYACITTTLSKYFTPNTRQKQIDIPCAIELILCGGSNYFQAVPVYNYTDTSPLWIQCTALEFMQAYTYIMNAPIK